MDNKARLVRVNKINHLQKSAADSWSDYGPLLVAVFARKGRFGILHDYFGLLLGDAMFGDMLAVPVDPAELHGRLQLRVGVTRPRPPTRRANRARSAHRESGVFSWRGPCSDRGALCPREQQCSLLPCRWRAARPWLW